VPKWSGRFRVAVEMFRGGRAFCEQTRASRQGHATEETEYRKEWGKTYEKPGISARIKAFFFRLMPKVGPLSPLAFHPPTPAVEQL
jgi:hypothetical protein